MWTTSSSHADVLAVIATAIFAGACSAPRSGRVDEAVVTADVPAPDSPRPASDARVPGPQRAPAAAALDAPVELRSVSVRSILRDTALLWLAGRPFADSARDPIVIDVRTQQPLGPLDRTSSPEIYLNGERVGDTRALPPDRLLAFLSSRVKIRAENTVAVAWLGNETATMTRRPLTFRAAEVGR